MWLKKHWKIFAFGVDTLIPPQYKFCHSVCVQNPEWSKNYTISKNHLPGFTVIVDRSCWYFNFRDCISIFGNIKKHRAVDTDNSISLA